MIKCIIFDCFGVIYPQASGNFFNKNKHLFGEDLTFFDNLNRQIDLGKISRTEFFTKLEEKIGIPADKMQAEIDQELVVDQQLIKLIKKLKLRYKIGLLSNAGKEENAIIYRGKINSLFDAIVVSYETGAVKPDHKIYVECAKRLGVETSECIFVDDSPSNLKGAKEVSMQTIHYESFGIIPKELNEKV